MRFGMNKQYKRQLYDYEADDMAEAERLRQRRLARRKRQQRQKRNRRLLMCAALLLLAILVFVLIPKSSQPLKGTWAYGETAELQFDGKDRGKIALHDTETECAFSYTAEENTLQIDFDNAYITDAAYTFTVEKDGLTLFGGDGTTGGTYALTKVKK